MQTYQVIFDVAEVGYRGWYKVLGGVAFFAFGVVFYRSMRQPTSASPLGARFHPAFIYVFIAIGLIWTTIVSVTSYSEYRKLSDALRSGRASIVEGQVTDFSPMPANGKGYERFCVRSQCFEYSDHVATEGFALTRTEGGPIENGLAVRVSYVGGKIARLEIAK